MLDTADTTDLVHDIPSIILDLQPCPIYAGSQRPRTNHIMKTINWGNTRQMLQFSVSAIINAQGQ